VNIPLIVGNPVVSYKETVTDQSSRVCLAKSQNNHNRLYAVAEPLSDKFCVALENKEIDIASAGKESKELMKTLVESFEWDKEEARKIWCFGPEQRGPNVFIDRTVGIQYLDEIKDSVETAF